MTDVQENLAKWLESSFDCTVSDYREEFKRLNPNLPEPEAACCVVRDWNTCCVYQSGDTIQVLAVLTFQCEELLPSDRRVLANLLTSALFEIERLSFNVQHVEGSDDVVMRLEARCYLEEGSAFDAIEVVDKSLESGKRVHMIHTWRNE